MHALANEIALAKGESASHGGAGSGSPLRIQTVDIEGKMDGGIVADVAESHFDDAADSVSILSADDDVGGEVTGQYHAS